jgi:alpha-L-fucosidase 2
LTLRPLLLAVCFTFAANGASSGLDLSRHDLVFDAPVAKWDEALPLGNGMMGILVWGNGRPLKLSLDRADLWDTRPVKNWESPDNNYPTLRRWVSEGKADEISNLFDLPYITAPGPMKIPAGRIELDLGGDARVVRSRLSIGDAEAEVVFSDSSRIRVFQHATEPVGMMVWRGKGTPPVLRLVPPAFGARPDTTNGRPFKDNVEADLSLLGYPSPREFSEGDSRSFEQQGWGTYRYAVAAVWARVPDGSWRAAWSIANTHESDRPLDLARLRAREALKRGWGALESSHRQWWKEYWGQSGVSIPNPVIERLWYRETYKFGSIARRGAPPISLQAVWTADNGKTPPWRGDYHHDLNTELSYWPCYEGNHLEEGLSFLDWLWEIRPEARRYAQNFYGLPGIIVPMTSDIEGKQMGGWSMYSHSSTMTPWLAQSFYLHWRSSMDREFLRTRAYPYLRDAAIFLAAITEKDSTGKRFLALSSSPEFGADVKKDRRWLPPTTNFDLALLRWLFSKTAECAGELGYGAEKAYWLSVLSECPDFAYSPEDGRLLVAPGFPLPESHRHFSHLLAIHPLSMIRWENGPRDQRIIRAALDELDRMGPDWWTGFSWSWYANLAARGRDGARAERALEIFSKAFCTANGFHVNGDQTHSGYSKSTYSAFTLEGNMAAASGVQEMLLQSCGGAVKVFPAVPASWKNAGFATLRAEGAFLVSADMRAGRVERIEVRSEKGGTLRIENPFPKGIGFRTELSGARRAPGEKDMLVFECRPGARVVLRAR